MGGGKASQAYNLLCSLKSEACVRARCLFTNAELQIVLILACFSHFLKITADRSQSKGQVGQVPRRSDAMDSVSVAVAKGRPYDITDSEEGCRPLLHDPGKPQQGNNPILIKSV